MMQNVSTWLGQAARQVTNFVTVQSPTQVSNTTEKEENIVNKMDKKDTVKDEPKCQTSAIKTEPSDQDKIESIESAKEVGDVAFEDKNEAIKTDSINENVPLSEKFTNEVVKDVEIASKMAVDAAKQWGNSIVTLAKEATLNAAETAKHLKSSVAEKTLLADFHNEQQKFEEEISSKQMAKQTAIAAVPPWVGCHDEALIKKQIMTLALDSRNFLRDPPSGSQFDFVFDHTYSIAMATLEEDPNLRKMRFHLVPKQVSEERFWRNYFYRVSLITQSANLSAMGKIVNSSQNSQQQPCTSDSHSTTASENKIIAEKEPDRTEINQFHEHGDFLVMTNDNSTEAPFVSEEELDRVRQQLGIVNSGSKFEKEDSDEKDDNWEQDILADLNDYELVTQETGKTEQEWEDEISQLLEGENAAKTTGEKTE